MDFDECGGICPWCRLGVKWSIWKGFFVGLTKAIRQRGLPDSETDD